MVYRSCEPESFLPFRESIPLKRTITLVPVSPRQTVREVFPHTAFLNVTTHRRGSSLGEPFFPVDLGIDNTSQIDFSASDTAPAETSDALMCLIAYAIHAPSFLWSQTFSRAPSLRIGYLAYSSKVLRAHPPPCQLTFHFVSL